MNAPSTAAETLTRRVAFLAGQAFALGLMMAFIVVPASTLFLERYGSGLLPVTYIGSAVVGAAATAALARSLRSRPLVAVATRTIGAFVLVLLGSWLLLWQSSAGWVSFVLLVLIPILVPIGFVVVVGQAGMLLDVRSLKAQYARVVAGFASGFVAGGLAAPLLISVAGRVEHLLAAAAAIAGILLGLIVLTRRTFPQELLVVQKDATDEPRPTMGTLARNRYVMLIVSFQMLSAVESQWLDYLVFDRAADRYPDSAELATFISRFTAIAYGADILFLLIVAGLLLRRFGLRFGLTANPLGVLALVGAVILTATLQASGATLAFIFVVAARVADLTLSDGAARTSLSAAYQVVPTTLRTMTQTTVEGLAVPVAVGLSGVGLVVVRATVGTDGIALPLITSVVLLAWLLVAVVLYRSYRQNLLVGLRRRTLDPAELTADDAVGAAVIERLLDSDDERDARLAFDALTITPDPGLSDRLERLTMHQRPTVRVNALERLVKVDAQSALRAARLALGDTHPDARCAAVRVIDVVGDASDAPVLARAAEDVDASVRVAAVAALGHLGDEMIQADLASDIARLAHAPAAHDRKLAARMLGSSVASSRIDRRLLRGLLADPEDDVVVEALAALHWPSDARTYADLRGLLHRAPTASAAAEALTRAGDAALPLVDEWLGDHGVGRRAHSRLARVCRTIGSQAATHVLHRHLDHLDRAVGLEVMTALAALEALHTANDRATTTAVEAEGDVARADLEYSIHTLRALLMFDDEASAGPLRSALRDELDLARQRVLASLAIRYGADDINRVSLQLAQPDPRTQALALEWLEVTLHGSARAAVALVQPDVADRDRLRALERRFTIEPMSRHDVMTDLLNDHAGRWRQPWLVACALYAAAGMAPDAVTGFDPGAPASSRTDQLAGAGEQHDIIHETRAAIAERDVRRADH